MRDRFPDIDDILDFTYEPDGITVRQAKLKHCPHPCGLCGIYCETPQIFNHTYKTNKWGTIYKLDKCMTCGKYRNPQTEAFDTDYQTANQYYQKRKNRD